MKIVIPNNNINIKELKEYENKIILFKLFYLFVSIIINTTHFCFMLSTVGVTINRDEEL